MDNDLDSVLASDQDVIPSSQFVKNVMAAVHRLEAYRSQHTLSVPWRRAIPGLMICGAALTSLMAVAGFQVWNGFIETSPVSFVFLNVVAVADGVELGSILLALFASIVPT